MAIPFTHAHSPRCNDPTGHTEYQEYRPRADSHQRLHDESSVKVYFVESSDAARGGVSEQLAMEQRHSTNQVEAQEHGHRQDDVHIGIRRRRLVAEGEPGGPGEHILTRDWMYGTD